LRAFRAIVFGPKWLSRFAASSFVKPENRARSGIGFRLASAASARTQENSCFTKHHQCRRHSTNAFNGGVRSLQQHTDLEALVNPPFFHAVSQPPEPPNESAERLVPL
jgi:hypothetical protein